MVDDRDLVSCGKMSTVHGGYLEDVPLVYTIVQICTCGDLKGYKYKAGYYSSGIKAYDALRKGPVYEFEVHVIPSSKMRSWEWDRLDAPPSYYKMSWCKRC